MSEQFKVGDVAKLIGGGPVMTVEAATDERVDCIWFVRTREGWLGPIRESFLTANLGHCFVEPSS